MVRDLAIDADHIIYSVCESKTYKNGFGVDDDVDNDANWGETVELDLTSRKEHFRAIIADYVLEAEVEGIIQGWTIGKVRIIMSDKTNFRYEVYPKYKAKRPPSSEVMSAMKAWAREEFECYPNTEADDVVAHYVRKGALGITTDKDLLLGVEGTWYNSHYMNRKWTERTKEDAEYFFKCQILGGDGVDGIPSIEGVAIKTADKLMKKHGSSYQDIIGIFNDKGYTELYMLTMARLVSMNQWTPKKGVKLWQIPMKD